MAKRAKSPADRSDDRLSDLVLRDGKSQPYRHIGRDAKTGHFIPVKEAHGRPRTSTVETVKSPKKGK